jgi:hypothetical protein
LVLETAISLTLKLSISFLIFFKLLAMPINV